MEDNRRTARYQIIPEADGNRYRFFCDLSGAALCFTQPVRASTPEEELALAWEQEGKHYFNHCRRCGRWVSNVMYNADRLQCVDCAPWEEAPKFCPGCGRKLREGETVCPRCGKSLGGGVQR